MADINNELGIPTQEEELNFFGPVLMALPALIVGDKLKKKREAKAAASAADSFAQKQEAAKAAYSNPTSCPDAMEKLDKLNEEAKTAASVDQIRFYSALRQDLEQYMSTKCTVQQTKKPEAPAAASAVPELPAAPQAKKPALPKNVLILGGAGVFGLVALVLIAKK